MLIRHAQPADFPEIIQVLKQSLGESLMPKSIQLWQWKHEQNPFGKSPVLVAVIDQQIVGIRAFLRWNWRYKKQTFHSLRAVDTAVLPEFQGKGIFSKLTKEMLAHCQQAGDHFVFNTPNTQSLPGYLKMGWQKAGRLPIQIQVHHLLPKKGPVTVPPMDQTSFASLAERASPISQQLHTSISKDYLIWRYANCPIADYQFLTDDESYVLIYRVKPSPLGLELRVADVLGLDQKKKINLKQLQKALRVQAKTWGVNFTACLASEQTEKILAGIGVLPVLPIGPQLTLRDLNLGEEFKFLLQKKNWGYALGDLEVF